MSKHLSRKYLAAGFFLTVSAVAFLFTLKMNAGEWIAAGTLALSVYTAASIADKKLNGDAAG